MQNSRKQAYIALIIAYLIWGASMPLSKPALEFASPTQLLFFRYILAVIVMTPFLIKRFAEHNLKAKHFPKIIFFEAINVGILLLLFLGLELTTALESSLILNTRAIFNTIAGIILLHEIEEKNEWEGLVLSIVGSTLIILGPLLLDKGNGFEISSLLGIGLILLSNLITSIVVTLTKRIYKPLHKPSVSGIGMWVGFLIFGILSLNQASPAELWQIAKIPEVLRAALFLGTLGLPVAVTLRLIGFNLIEASEASLFRYIQPIVYLPLAVFWLKESVYWPQLLGLSIVIAGVIIAERRPDLSEEHLHHTHQ